jgi:hypothetical protein
MVFPISEFAVPTLVLRRERADRRSLAGGTEQAQPVGVQRCCVPTPDSLFLCGSGGFADPGSYDRIQERHHGPKFGAELLDQSGLFGFALG